MSDETTDRSRPWWSTWTGTPRWLDRWAHRRVLEERQQLPATGATAAFLLLSIAGGVVALLAEVATCLLRSVQRPSCCC